MAHPVFAEQGHIFSVWGLGSQQHVYFHLLFVLGVFHLFYTLYYPFREIQATLQQPQQQRYPVLQVYAGSFRVSAIQRTLTGTTGSLTCIRDHSYACACTRGVGHTDNESAQLF